MITCRQCGATVPSGIGHSCWATSSPPPGPLTNGWPTFKITSTPPRPDLGEEIAKVRSDVTILKGMVSHLLDLVRELQNIESRVDAILPKVERIEANTR